MANPNEEVRNEALRSYMIYENEVGTANKPPKIMTWDNDFEVPFEQGPYTPMTTTSIGPVPKPVTSYNDNNRNMFSDVHKAFGVVSVCLSREIAQTLRDYTTAKALWDALVSMSKGNFEMRNSRKGMFNGEFNMFNYVQGESITRLIHRFETLVTKIKSAGIEYDQISDNLLNSLSYT
ncbi:uncharacterized protein LOC143607035 [Bidens hawaiensis]|uniref:uncharacterized protein LOC143607035 n=1 Tax=Bidens hawaiensis TaxID=980011 RepID=UPI00404A93FB